MSSEISMVHAASFEGGAQRMLKVDQIMDILELKNQGHSLRAISEMTGHARNTVKKVLEEKHPTQKTRK